MRKRKLFDGVPLKLPPCPFTYAIRFSNIVWDTDGEQVDLPKEAIITVPGDTDLDTQGADILSDKYGWCVRSFDWEIA